MLTLITHVYNEHYLLEAWVRHHLDKCDHAIIIDYASTDGGPALARALAPQWTVVQSQNRDFRAADVDREVMAYETQIEGWKLALNVTEFAPDLRPVLRTVERDHPTVQAVGLPSFVMVGEGQPDPAELIPGCHHGYADDPTPQRRAVRGFRFVHRAPHGNYEVGRHGVGMPAVVQYDVRLLWFGWAPMEEQRRRKLQIQTRIPADDRAVGHGWQHILDAEELERRYQAEAARTVDLRDDAVYRRWFGGKG